MYKNDPLFLSKISRDSSPDVDAIRWKYYICLTSEADRRELQFHANCSIFQVLICLKELKNEKSGTLVLSLVLDVPIPHLAIYVVFPVTPASRLTETRMFTFQNLKFKAKMNNQRMNATELFLYLWLLLSLDTIFSVRALGVNGDINDKEMKVLLTQN